MTEEITTSTNVFEDLDLPFESKAWEIVNEFIDEIRSDEAANLLIKAIASALKEAVEGEREACAKVAETDDSFMMFQDFGLQSAVTEKGQNIARAIRSRRGDSQ